MKFKFNKTLIFISLLMLCLFASGCTTDASVPSATEETMPAFALGEANEAEEPSEYPVYINETEINSAPEKVVSLSPWLTEIICEMGYGSKLVGKCSYCDYPEEIFAVPEVGKPSQPDISAIIGLSPDILFTSTAIPNKDIIFLNDNGIKTVYISAPRSLEDLKGVYYGMALAFEGAFDAESTSEKAYKIIADSIPAGKSLGKYIYVTEGLNIAGRWTLEESVLSLFGDNAAGDIFGYAFEKEFLLENEPDVIILNSQFTAEDLASDEILSQLSAYNNGKIISIDNSYFECPSGRISELISLLGDIESE